MSRRGVIGCMLCRAQRLFGRTDAVVDVHAHIQVADYLALAAEAGLRRPSFASASPVAPTAATDSEEDLEARIRLMDAAGVRLQVLSPTLAPYLEDGAVAVTAVRLLNDRHAAIAAAHPGRLASYVSLPLPHVDAALAELRRGLDELGMVGVTMQCSCLGLSFADPRFEPLFREMHARGAVLFLHPSVNGLRSPLPQDWGLTPSVGPLMEDATAALHVMVRNIPVRYPSIRIIVPHLGGGLATMLERLDNQLPQFTPGLMARPSEMARALWYDTVSHGSAVGLRAAVEAFGAARLLPGSDFPVLLGFEPYGRTFDYVRDAGLGARSARRILYENAPKLLRL